MIGGRLIMFVSESILWISPRPEHDLTRTIMVGGAGGAAGANGAPAFPQPPQFYLCLSVCVSVCVPVSSIAICAAPFMR